MSDSSQRKKSKRLKGDGVKEPEKHPFPLSGEESDKTSVECTLPKDDNEEIMHPDNEPDKMAADLNPPHTPSVNNSSNELVVISSSDEEAARGSSLLHKEREKTLSKKITHLPIRSDEGGTCIELTSSDEETPSGLTPSEEERLPIDHCTPASLSLIFASASDTETSIPVTSLLYQLKQIPWQGRFVSIVTQNENGPCPLIALANVLLLRGIVLFPDYMKALTGAQLVDCLADCLVENVPEHLLDSDKANYEKNLYDAISAIPHLLTGLNVNVQFTGVRDFEFTRESTIFDQLNIVLYHGWLVDPQMPDVVAAVGKMGYNQLIEKIIANKYSSNSELMTHALTAEGFLQNNATQLTYHGLCELNCAMVPNEIAVFFRNNHFSTIIKRGNELFQLVTDQGFLHEQRVVWEALRNIDGDSLFVDGYFNTHSSQASEDGRLLPDSLTSMQQIDQDFLVALSLQEDQPTDQKGNESWDGFEEVGSNPDMAAIDLELARRLQLNYHRESRAVPSGSPSSSSHLRSPDRTKNRSGCTIL